MRPKGKKDLAAFSAREVKRVAAEERERDEYSSAEVGVKIIPARFLKVEGRRTLVGTKDQEERDR